MSRLTHLECTKCGERLPADRPQTVCPKDGGVLYARYDLKSIASEFDRAKLKERPATMWRYREVLPDAKPVTLGEGFTPMLRSREFHNVLIKDEGLNPTGSFKARGLSAAVTMAKAYGLKKLAIPSAGNAASAMAAYAAHAGIEAHIFMPKDVPLANRVECESYGAKVNLINGLISDCARIVAERKESEGWFDVSTLKEPFRVEGKKTMGYEVVEQLGWRMPQGIIYPTGGGVGLLGMWKAFEEMEQLGWIGSDRPKMVCVQSGGCAPIVKAWDEHKKNAEMWANAATVAAGRTLTIAAPAIGEYPQTVIKSRTARKRTPTNAPKSRPRQAFAGQVRPSDERQPSSSSEPRGAAKAAIKPRTATGACAAKIARQSKSCVSTPPSAGPSARPNVPASVQIAAPLVTDPVRSPSTGSAPARSSAAPTPWTQRAEIRKGRLSASEQASDARKKASRPAIRIPLARTRWTSTISPNAATATAAL